MTYREENHTLRNVATFAAGVGVGIGVGILFAPASGKEIRSSISEKVQEFENGSPLSNCALRPAELNHCSSRSLLHKALSSRLGALPFAKFSDSRFLRSGKRKLWNRLGTGALLRATQARVNRWDLNYSRPAL